MQGAGTGVTEVDTHRVVDREMPNAISRSPKTIRRTAAGRFVFSYAMQ